MWEAMGGQIVTRRIADTGTKFRSTRPKEAAILAGAVAAIGLMLLILYIQSHSPVHQTPKSGTSMVPAPSLSMPIQQAPTVAPASAGIAVPAIPAPTGQKAPSLALQFERVWKLRVFGFTVFRYDAKVEGPRK